MDTWWGTTATTSIFIAAAITDWLDGYLARKMKLGSAFGAFLDPVADKLMVAATLVLLCAKPPEVALFEQFPWLLTIPSIAIIGRELMFCGHLPCVGLQLMFYFTKNVYSILLKLPCCTPIKAKAMSILTL